MQVVAIIAVFLGLLATGLIGGAYVSQDNTNNIDCSDYYGVVQSDYGGNSDKCYDDVYEREANATLMNGIGGALMWFSLILAISSNRLE
jgi:hypothetical protein